MELSAKQLKTLHACVLFRDLTAEQLQQIVQEPGCECREFPKGVTIYGGKNFERCLGLILDGSVSVSKPTDHGRDLAISRLSDGMLFGAAAIFNEAESFANVLTSLENCRVLFMQQQWFQWVLQRHFSVAEAYIRYLSERILFLNERIAALAAGSADQCVAHFLLQNGPSITISMTELASRLNIGRASLYRVMDRMEAEGIIARTGKNIEIKHPERLHVV